MTSNVMDRQKRFVDADFFENGKKSSVFENIRIRVDRQKRSDDLKTLRVEADTCGRGLV